MRLNSWSRWISWGAIVAACIALSGLFVACEDGTAPGQVCTAGQVVGCTCADQSPGAQVCSSNAWTACNCQAGQCQAENTVACRCGTQTGSQTCTGGSWAGCNCAAGGCTDGQSLVCQCANGGAGKQNCTGGSWGTCDGCSTVNPPPPPAGDCPTPGDTGACTCTDGTSGNRTCGADKKWAPCQCVAKPPDGDCNPGQSQACTCTDGRSSTRVCGTDKKWGACTCQPQNLCNDGESRDCICSNRGAGKQKCELQSGGTFDWGSCVNCIDPTEACPKPGDTKRCFCPNGAGSYQTCAQDGKWGTCDCGGPACVEGEVRKDDCDCPSGFRGDNKCVKDAVGNLSYVCQCDCTPNEKRECPCANSQKGERICGANKQWGGCLCPKCKTDADCTSQGIAKICDINTEKCVECLDAKQCSAGQVCDLANAACVDCTTDADCTGKPDPTCYPLDNTCKKFGVGSIEGLLRRCRDTAGQGQCTGNQPKGDDKGRIYFMFYTGKNFPPPYKEKPFFVHKTDIIDFKDPTLEIKYKIDNIPEGDWLVYVFIDDNNNWSPGQHLPDPGDLVGFIKGVKVTAGMTNTQNFPLTDRY